MSTSGPTNTISSTASSTNLPPNIHEIHDFKDILNYIAKDTIFITDLDETIFHTNQTFPGSPWFDSYYKQHGIVETLKHYVPGMQRSEVGPAHPDVVKILKEMQDKNIPMFALTSRGAVLKEATFKQLASIGVDFNRGLLQESAANYVFSGSPFWEDMEVAGGVIFSAGYDKGTCFEDFVAKTNNKPKAIVYSDDKLSHVQSMQKACEKMGIQFTGLWCRYLAHKFENVDHGMTNIQVELANKLLSDEEAKLIQEARAWKAADAVVTYAQHQSTPEVYERPVKLGIKLPKIGDQFKRDMTIWGVGQQSDIFKMLLNFNKKMADYQDRAKIRVIHGKEYVTWRFKVPLRIAGQVVHALEEKDLLSAEQCAKIWHDLDNHPLQVFSPYAKSAYKAPILPAFRRSTSDIPQVATHSVDSQHKDVDMGSGPQV